MKRGDIWRGANPGCNWYYTYLAYQLRLQLLSLDRRESGGDAGLQLTGEQQRLTRDFELAVKNLPDSISDDLQVEDEDEFRALVAASKTAKERLTLCAHGRQSGA